MIFVSKIRGENYAVVRCPMADHDGYGMGSPNVMLLGSGTSGKDFLNTVIHEFKHQFDPDCKESVVTKFADELTEIMWKIGFRLNEAEGVSDGVAGQGEEGEED